MEYYCYRCGHRWKSRKKTKPIACPKCKTPYWSVPKKRTSRELIENTKNIVIKLHNRIIIKSGGELGIRDEGGLHHAIFKILNFKNKNENDPYAVGAFIYQDLAKRSHFMDGNKRTSHCFAKMILLTMDYHLKPRYYNATKFILQIARDKNSKTFKEIKEWIKKNSFKIDKKNIATYLKELHYDITNERGEAKNE